MPRRTNPFQNLSAAIMAVFFEPKYLVEESVLERHPRTDVIREIDIRITSRSNPEDRLLVECRAHKRRQDVQWIDTLDGKGRSLGFPKIIAVSASGFTKAALKEAHDRGIETLHLRDAVEADWRKWFMAIQELGVKDCSVVFRSVDFGVDANWGGILPSITELADVILVDTRDNTRIPLLDWIDRLLNDPKEAAQLQTLAMRGNLTDLRKLQPCSPGMGFLLKGQNEFIPLVELVVHVDINISDHKIPLKHLDAEGKRILVGESQICGMPTRVVMHENGKELTMLYEQKRSKI